LEDQVERFVEWSDDLSVGIEEIDNQHKVLVDLVNEMHAAIQQRKGSEAVQRVLSKLADYTRIHYHCHGYIPAGSTARSLSPTVAPT
jgi:hemerythrin